MKKILGIILLVLIMAACKKIINSPAITAPNSYLVVNGSITPNDTTVINLSRTVNVSGTTTRKQELNATINIEGSGGTNYPLVSQNDGDYKLLPSNLPSTQNYRLNIKTSDGKQYQSDFVPVKNSPAIDSVSRTIKNNALQVNVNTHDDANNTKYYRWDYTETYIIHAAFISNYMEVNHDTTALRPPDKEIYECWRSDTTSSIILGSSAKLSRDVVSNFQITSMPSNSEKVRIRYSIMVKQYALTADAYNYYAQLKQNTESLGTIFDPQPSDLAGNFHCITNPSEPVIGYLTAGNITRSRIFIDNKDVPKQWVASTPYDGCPLDSIFYIKEIPTTVPGAAPTFITPVHDLIYTDIEIPIDPFGAWPTGGFTGAFPVCADCTLRGTNKKPSFWK